jgi:hypothetical protein
MNTCFVCCVDYLCSHRELELVEYYASLQERLVVASEALRRMSTPTDLLAIAPAASNGEILELAKSVLR